MTTDDTPGDALCICGHPRRMHEWISDEYPAICGHAAPRAVDPDPATDPMAGVCMCLRFENDDG